MSEYVVQIDNIAGESKMTVTNATDGTSIDSQNLIDCVSMHHAIDQLVTNTASTRLTGTSRHGPVEFTHVVDAASPKLRQAAAGGTNLGKVIIKRVASASVGASAIETITLTNAYVVRVDTDTPVDPQTHEPAVQPRESFAMEYDSITWSAATVSATGAVTGTVEAGYSTGEMREL